MRGADGGGALAAGIWPVGDRVGALPVHLPVAPPALVVVAPSIPETTLAMGLTCNPAPAVHPDDHVFESSAEVGRKGLVRDLRGKWKGSFHT